MRKSISPVVAVIVIVAVVAVAVGAYLLWVKQTAPEASRPNMKGGNEPNPNARKTMTQPGGAPGAAQRMPAGTQGPPARAPGEGH